MTVGLERSRELIYPESDGQLMAVYVRGQMALRLIWFVGSFVSPRLGIRFDLLGLILLR